MPMSPEERTRELEEAEAAKAAHEAYLQQKQDGTLPEDAVDPDPDVEG